MWSTAELVAAMTKLRLTNIDNRHDRGSYRMRYIAAAFLCMVGRKKPTLVFSGTALSRACAFGVITGGLGMCVLEIFNCGLMLIVFCPFLVFVW